MIARWFDFGPAPDAGWSRKDAALRRWRRGLTVLKMGRWGAARITTPDKSGTIYERLTPFSLSAGVRRTWGTVLKIAGLGTCAAGRRGRLNCWDSAAIPMAIGTSGRRTWPNLIFRQVPRGAWGTVLKMGGGHLARPF